MKPDPSLIRILIVDDKPANLVALDAVLGSSGYTVVKAGSGEEALRLVEGQEFALILLDVQMPGLSGYETARHIKRLPGAESIPIVFITAVYKEEEDVRRGYEAGAIDFVTKPFDPKLLRAKVRIYADLYVKTRQLTEHERALEEMTRRLQTEAALKVVLQTVPVGVVIVEGDGASFQMNAEAQRIWGVEGVPSFERYSARIGWWAGTEKRVRPGEWALERALKQGASPRNDIIDIQAFDGARRTILNSATPLKDAEGRNVGAVAVIEDITDLESQREAIKRGRDVHAAAAAAMKTEP